MAGITKLEAVNTILAAIGEQPVSSLSSGLVDAEAAEVVLTKTTKDVLARGYHCNTDHDFELVPDVDGYIWVPSGTLSVDPVDRSQDYVVRDGKLYDRDEQTYVFTESVKVDLIQEMDFEDLPYALARYIEARSARIFQEQVEGSISLDGFTARQEAEAKAVLEDSNVEQDDYNVLRHSPSVRVIAWRNNRLQDV